MFCCPNAHEYVSSLQRGEISIEILETKCNAQYLLSNQNRSQTWQKRNKYFIIFP